MIVLFLLSLVLAFAICTQKEEDYLQFFEAVGEVPSEAGDEVKVFLNELIQEVENRNMILESQLKTTSSRRIIFGFEDKLNEYETKIAELNNSLGFAKREAKGLKHANERLESENMDLRKNVERLSITLSDLSDRNKEELSEALKSQEAAFHKRMTDVTRRLSEAELEADRLRTKLAGYKQKNKALKEENLSQNRALSDISENYVDKEQHERDRKERQQLQQRVLEMENNYALEVSETRSLKQTLTRKEKELRKFEKRDKDYRKKIEELRQRNSQQPIPNVDSHNLIKSNLTNPIRNYSNNRKVKAYGLDSYPNRDQLSNSDFDSDSRASPRKRHDFSQMNANIEKLNKNMEVFRVKKNDENEEHERIVERLMDDIKMLKKKNNGGESHYKQSRTSRFKSQNISGERGVGEKMIKKNLELEKKVKELSSENTYLTNSILKNTSSHRSQIEILYSVVSSYIDN